MAGTIARLNWDAIEQSLDDDGNAVLPGLLEPDQCREVSSLYGREGLFRARIIMARHGFGKGEYQYFSYPLPALVETLRRSLYPPLVPIANRWNHDLGIHVRYPEALDDFLHRCHDAGQTRPTPLILRYVRGDYNCLHQDLYGEHVFPLQVAILLSEPGKDFTGGEFVMTETLGSTQRAGVVRLCLGDAVVFTVNQRPVAGKRGLRKAAMRHGVSQVHCGNRYTMGLIFHDAR